MQYSYKMCSINGDSLNGEHLTSCQPQQNGKRGFKFTVELPCVLFSFGTALEGAIINNLLLYRTCTDDLHYNETKCSLLNFLNKSEEAKAVETDVEKMTTVLLMTLSILSGIIPAFLSIFLGSWSDKYGRKPLITCSIFGHILTAILATIYNLIPSLNSWWYVVCMIPCTFSGGSITFNLGTNLMITDITEDRFRSLRLAIIQGCAALGAVLGTVSSSYVLNVGGYVSVFGFSALLFLFSFLYTLICINESLASPHQGTLQNLFNYDLLKDMGAGCFKKRPLNITMILFLLITSYALTEFCLYGIANVDYLFTREKFQWLLKDYSTYSAVNMTITIFGTFFGLYFFKSICKITEGILLIISYASSLSQALVQSLSQKSWHLYLGAAISILSGLAPPVIQSQVAKVVPKEEIGRMFSLLSCVEALSPVICPMIFSIIYFKTLSVFPGAIYAVSAGMYLICMVFVTVAEIILYKSVVSKVNHTMIN